MFIGEISALTAALLWSNASIVFTAATIKLGPIQLNVDRMALATILLAVTMLIIGLEYKITTYQFIMLGLSGIIGLVMGDSFFVQILQHDRTKIDYADLFDKSGNCRHIGILCFG